MEIKKRNDFEMASCTELDRWIRRSEQLVVYEIIFGFFILALFGFLMYQKAADNFLWFLIGIMGLLFFVGVYIYGGTIRRAKIINSTVKKIKRKEEDLLIKTFPYNILGIKKVFQKEIRISINALDVKECDYPIMDKKKIKSKALCIRDINSKNSYFIILQFFPESIKKYFS